MRFLQRFGILLILVLIGGSQWASWQFQNAQKPLTDQQRLQVSLLILESSGSTRRLSASLSELSRQYFNSAYFLDSELTDDELDRLELLLTEELVEEFPDLIRKIAQLYEVEFTDEQLIALLDFYQSDSGAVLIERGDELFEQSLIVSADWSERKTKQAADRMFRRAAAEGIDIKSILEEQKEGAVTACRDSMDADIPNLDICSGAIVRLGDSDERPYIYRATIFTKLGRNKSAISDLDKSLEIAPDNATAHYNRGVVNNRLGNYREALSDYNAGIRADPNMSIIWNNKAWLLATCPDDSVRSGMEAVETALQAVALSPRYNTRSTLAAAYAENGEFDKAIQEQEQAIVLLEMENLSSLLPSFQMRLDLYKKGEPYRDL